jgi:hypothetical protein
VAPIEAMGRARREHEARLHRGRDLAIAGGLAFGAWIVSRQGPVGGKPVFGYLAAALLLAASAMSIPSALACFGWMGTLARRWTGVEWGGALWIAGLLTPLARAEARVLKTWGEADALANRREWAACRSSSEAVVNNPLPASCLCATASAVELTSSSLDRSTT